jgi:cytochrome c oxidase subunit 3
MDIPYTLKARPDTGLYNAKLGIWLFLASEVMLFGGLFSAYILLRVGSAPGDWPHGWLDVKLGTINTLLLALSAITTLLAWASCKVREFGKFKFFHACTILLALAFLGIKSYEYHDKWIHYEIQLTNGHFADGHFESAIYVNEASKQEVEKHSYLGKSFSTITDGVTNKFDLASVTINGHEVEKREEIMDLRSEEAKKAVHKPLTIAAADIKKMQNYGPWHNTFTAIYFTLSGLHALHILGGTLVIFYLWGPGSKMYKTDPERFTNRIEVSGLFWHFVDLVWIFLFPVLYLT